MKKYFIWLGIFIGIYGCSEEKGVENIIVEGHAQGTTYRIVYHTKTGENYQRSIDSLLIHIDNSLSTYNKRSVITKINNSEGGAPIDEMFADVFELSKLVFKDSDGAFDPTIAPIVNAWGFGFKNMDNLDSAMINNLRSLVNFNRLIIRNDSLIKDTPGIMVDFNAIAQGYSVDVIGDFLTAKNVDNYMVEIGGEVRVKGVNSEGSLWRIGIDKPQENSKQRQLKAIINLDNQALATSGNYRKFYEKNGLKYAHTINPKTGYPVQHSLLSATVLAPSAAIADAYATVFMVVGIEEAKRILANRKDLNALLIYGAEKNEIKTFATDEISNFIELVEENE